MLSWPWEENIPILLPRFTLWLHKQNQKVLTMKPIVRGKKLYFREVVLDDADFILKLRTDPRKNRHLSPTTNDISQQRTFIQRYKQSLSDYYFIICDWEARSVGTVRIYDIQCDSFCWGSWILSDSAPSCAAIESALLLYDFAFFSLHYTSSHFDVRKNNSRVVCFHERFGAKIIDEDECNFYFSYDCETYIKVRQKYAKYLPELYGETR